jgi:hypothetical protein
MASKPLLPTNQITVPGPSPSDQKGRGATRRTTKAAHKLKVLPEQPEPAAPSRVIPEEEEEDGDDEEEEATVSGSDAADDDDEVEVSPHLFRRGHGLSVLRSHINKLHTFRLGRHGKMLCD